MRLLHIVAAYTTIHYEMNDLDQCLVVVRDKEPRWASIEEVTNNFLNIPWVIGCGGIMHTYIFNTETKESIYL